MGLGQEKQRLEEKKSGWSIGRIYYAQPSNGERFCLRMLLNVVKGATSFLKIN